MVLLWGGFLWGQQLLFLLQDYLVNHYSLALNSKKFIFWYSLLLRSLQGAGIFLFAIYLLSSPSLYHTFSAYISSVSSRRMLRHEQGFCKKIVARYRHNARFSELVYRLPILFVPVVVYSFSVITGQSFHTLLGNIVHKTVLCVFICISFLVSSFLRATFWHRLYLLYREEKETVN